MNPAKAVALAVAPLAVAGFACDRQVSSRPLDPSAGMISTIAPMVDATAAVAPAPAGYLRGSTHVHTAHSGDSTTSPTDVIAWYELRGYDFIVVTDHNRVSDVEHDGSLLVLHGIELTNNPASCDPPPPQPGGKCRIHANSLLVTQFPPYVDGERPPKIEWRAQNTVHRIDLYQAAIDKNRELGGLIQLNHPTWHWGTDGALLTELGRRGFGLVEIANSAFAQWNAGDGSFQSAEAIWDAALSAGVTIYGVASDDAHHYDEGEIQQKRVAGDAVYPPGGGWIMVHAEKVAESIRDALARGDFYSSSGVVLEAMAVDGGDYVVTVADTSPGEHDISFIGTGGAVLSKQRGRTARLALADMPAGYVRAVVENASGQKAWTQPVTITIADAP